MKTILISSAFLFLLAASAPLNSTSRCNFDDTWAEEAGEAVSNLAVQLYRKIVKPKENAVFSPVSIALALALLESGSDGQTRTEIQKLLNSADSNQSDSNELYSSLQHHLQIRTEKATLNIANGFFYDEKLNLKSSYLSNAKDCFETEVSKASFENDPEGARQSVNGWVANATKDKIQELFKKGSIDKTTVAVLANAIYLMAPWDQKFEKTENMKFYRSGSEDQVQTVPFMIQTEDHGYASTDSLDVLELSYKQVPLSMFIILPKQRDGMDAVERDLSGGQLLSLFDQTNRRSVEVKLPKFTIRLTVPLTQVLQQLGVQKMFTDAAEFNRMTNDSVKVSDAVHEAYIKVNENGTEAAAATGFAMVLMSAQIPEKPVPFVADHPFIYAIVHRPTKAIVFMGKVNSVENNE